MPADDAVLQLFRNGVANVETVTTGWSEADWDRPACGTWTGIDLAGHLVTVVRWYHQWLDRGLAGTTDPMFAISDLSRETARALNALEAGDGPSRIATFRSDADRYASRLVEHWDAPFTYPRGLVTAGLHAGVAASEWNLHAWDFAHSAGLDFEPVDAERLYTATAACLMAVTGGVRGRVGMRVADRIARRRAWLDLLRRSGRSSADVRPDIRE